MFDINSNTIFLTISLSLDLHIFFTILCVLRIQVVVFSWACSFSAVLSLLPYLLLYGSDLGVHRILLNSLNRYTVLFLPINRCRQILRMILS